MDDRVSSSTDNRPIHNRKAPQSSPTTAGSHRRALKLVAVTAFVFGVLVLLASTMDVTHDEEAVRGVASRALRLEPPGWLGRTIVNPATPFRREALIASRVGEHRERVQGLRQAPHRPATSGWLVRGGRQGPVKRLPESRYEDDYHYDYFGGYDDDDDDDDSDSDSDSDDDSDSDSDFDDDDDSDSNDSDDSDSGSRGRDSSGSGRSGSGAGAGIQSSIVTTTDGVNIGNTITNINIQGIDEATAANSTTNGAGNGASGVAVDDGDRSAVTSAAVLAFCKAVGCDLSNLSRLARLSSDAAASGSANGSNGGERERMSAFRRSSAGVLKVGAVVVLTLLLGVFL